MPSRLPPHKPDQSRTPSLQRVVLRAFTGVGSEVAHKVALTLATVRRSNVVCGFPAPRFHEDSFFRDAIEGIN